MIVSVLIDDDALQARLIVDNLRTVGHIVRWSRQGWDGLLAVHRVHPDLIILDWGVPQAPELLMLLRAMRGFSATRLLLIATRCPPEYYLKKWAVSGCLGKPLDADELVRQVQRTVQGGAPVLPPRPRETAPRLTPAFTHRRHDQATQEPPEPVL